MPTAQTVTWGMLEKPPGCGIRHCWLLGAQIRGGKFPWGTQAPLGDPNSKADPGPSCNVGWWMSRLRTTLLKPREQN